MNVNCISGVVVISEQMTIEFLLKNILY